MRILQVVHGFPPEGSGGGDLYAARLTGALAALPKLEVRAVAGTARDGFPEGHRIDETVDGVPVTRIQRTFTDPSWSSPWRSPTCRARFREVLGEAAPEIVHVHHLTNLDLELPRLARDAGARVLYTLHDYWLACQRGQLIDRSLRPCPGPGLRRCASCWPGPGGPARLRRIAGFRGRQRLLARSLAAVDVLVAPALRIADWFETWMREARVPDRPRILVEPYGMPPLRPTRTLRDPGRTSAAERPLRLGFLGTMMFTKGLHVVLEALVARADPWNLSIDCFGGVSDYHEIGGYGAYLESLRRRRPETIRFRGPFLPEDLPDVLGGLDALCCPSLWPENSPLVIHEALQAGLPVLGSRVGGIPELVREGRDGFLLPPEDVDAWRALLDRLEADADVVRRLPVSDKSVQGLDTHAERMAGLYRSLLDS